MAATKIPFRTAYSGQLKRITTAGTGIIEEYGYEYNKNNQKELVKTGEKNGYEEIQSYAEACKIENILKRAAIGDMSDFRPDGIYTDVTGIPNNLIDARKEILKVEKVWNAMPIDVKRKYNHNIDEFMADMGTQSWLIATGLINPKDAKEAPHIEPEKTTVEVPKENTKSE